MEIIILSEVSQIEKDISYDISYMQNLKKMIQMNLFIKQKHNELMVTGGKGGEGMDWEFGIDMYTLLYLKQIIKKDLLYSTGNSAQYSVIT